MGVEKALDGSQDTGLPAYVGGMGIHFLVGVAVMPPMGGNPPDEVTLHRHAAKNSERVDDGRARLEARMSEKTMKSDRDSEACQKVHHAEERQIHGAEITSPEKDHRRDNANQRQKNHHDADQPPEESMGSCPMQCIRRPLQFVVIGDFSSHRQWKTILHPISKTSVRGRAGLPRMSGLSLMPPGKKGQPGVVRFPARGSAGRKGVIPHGGRFPRDLQGGHAHCLCVIPVHANGSSPLFRIV